MCLFADGVCVQSLEHPGCVWDAKFLDSGDILTACSDGVVRIWTVQPEKVAEPLEIEAYAAELSSYKLSRYNIRMPYNSVIYEPFYNFTSHFGILSWFRVILM